MSQMRGEGVGRLGRGERRERREGKVAIERMREWLCVCERVDNIPIHIEGRERERRKKKGTE